MRSVQFISLLYMLHVCVGKLLVISFDGFRNSYLDSYSYLMPNLNYLRDNGVRAVNGIKSSFVTMTFPCHWTIATGLDQQSHGLVSNAFYDRKGNVSFNKRSNDKRFYGGEAIWTTCKKAGKKVAIIMWVGSGVVDTDGYKADIVLPYQETMPLQERVTRALDATRHHDLTMMYWHQPDEVGHRHGPSGIHLTQQLALIDKQLERIVNRTREKENDLNVIVLSDHGMALVKQVTTLDIADDFAVKKDHFTPELLDNITSLTKSMIISGTSTMAHFYYPENNLFERDSLAHFLRCNIVSQDDLCDVEEAIAALATRDTVITRKPINHRGITYFLKNELPEGWLYRSHEHVGDLIALADEGFAINITKSVSGRSESVYMFREDSRGAHGYDNNLQSMRSVFVAIGPAFIANSSLDKIIPQQSIYSLMCHLLRIDPAPNNGSLSHFKSSLANSQSVSSSACKSAESTLCSLSLAAAILFVIIHQATVDKLVALVSSCLIGKQKLYNSVYRRINV